MNSYLGTLLVLRESSFSRSASNMAAKKNLYKQYKLMDKNV